MSTSSSESRSTPVFAIASTPPILHSCRWAWCCLNFNTNADLVNHVVHDHVMMSRPVRRRDVPLLRRAEEGVGESQSLTSAMHAIDMDQRINGNDASDVTFEEFVRSPPPSSISSPSSSSATSVGVSTTPPPFSTQLHEPALHTSTPQKSRSPSPRGSKSPLFASLSSPERPSDIPSLPPSPSFNDLVSRAEHASPVSPYPSTSKSEHGRRSQSREPPRTPGRATLPMPQTSDSVHSHTSSSSGETVEKQLTQGMDMDVDTDDDGDRTASVEGTIDFVDLPESNLQSQEQTEAEVRGTDFWPPLSQGRTATALRQSQSHPAVEAPIPLQPKLNILRQAPYPSEQISRQTWYQAPSSYFRRRPKRVSVNGNGVSMPPKHAGITPVRSYSESALPSATPNREKKLSQIQEEGPGSHAHGVSRSVSTGNESRGNFVVSSPQVSQPPSPDSQPSQSSSVESNVNPFPFAYLQTQAPYQSQSLSQC